MIEDSPSWMRETEKSSGVSLGKPSNKSSPDWTEEERSAGY